jgi:hypothetical protein
MIALSQRSTVYTVWRSLVNLKGNNLALTWIDQFRIGMIGLSYKDKNGTQVLSHETRNS